MADPLHSDFILTDARDDWWNTDFLALMARRLDLSSVRRVLDVGSGQGHWGQLWAPYLAPDATLLGVEREPRWVELATRRSRALGLEARFTYVEGLAEALPAPDETFDLVTCQTVLMHVADPVRVVDELVRVLALGGRLFLAEPNNLMNLIMRDGTQEDLPLADYLGLVRFHATCNAGRRRLGEGDHAIADRLPQILADAGLEQIQVYLNDHAAPVLTGAPAKASTWRALDERADSIERGAWLWDPAEAERLYLAGGGNPAEFTQDHAVFQRDARAHVQAIRARRYSATGGAQHYLVCGRRAG